jgi:peptidoglycan-N-acetylglucosamine deacetylase
MDGPAVEIGRGRVPMGINSCGRYAVRRGVPRYLEMLARHGIQGTFFVCGRDAEDYPSLIRDIHAEGHEIGAHGYVHESWDLGDDEPALLEKTHVILSETVGVAPIGWCSPSGRKSVRTLPTLRRLGYRYDASEKDDDRPYLACINDEHVDDFIILPNNTVSLNDFALYSTGYCTPSEVEQCFLDELSALKKGSGFVHLAIHPKAGGGSGTPARANAIDRFLTAVRGQADVQFMTLKQVADYCLENPSAWLRA